MNVQFLTIISWFCFFNEQKDWYLHCLIGMKLRSEQRQAAWLFSYTSILCSVTNSWNIC